MTKGSSGDAQEADDDRTVLGCVDFPVLIVDGEWLTPWVANSPNRYFDPI